MKHLLLTIALILGMGMNVYSQTPLTNAVDFTHTDLDGNTHNLFSLLNSGKWVAIDFHAYWCGTCMTLAADFGQSFQDYGCNTSDVFFMTIELEGTTNQCEDFDNNYGGGHEVPYLCNASSIHNDYGIQAFPTIILINPNGVIVEQDIWPFDTNIMASTLASHGLNPSTCSGTVSVQEMEEVNYELNNRMYDLLGREYKDYNSIPLGSMYIRNNNKFIKTKQ
jgi:thiol-disulfide isomerase/thioredoxin